MKIQRKLKRKSRKQKPHVKQNPSGLRSSTEEPVYEQQQEPVYEEQPQPTTYQNIKRNSWRSMLSNR